MDFDEYGEVINGENTYICIGNLLKKGNSVIIGWTDEHCTHYDILFNLNVIKHGELQGGLRWNDLFVSIMRRGAFGFLTDNEKDSNYVAEKLGLLPCITADKITELINGVIKRLKGDINYD